MTDTVRLTVRGMTCGGCEQSVTRAVTRLPGIEQVHASRTDEAVTVTFDRDLVAPDTIAGAIANIGYTVEAAA